MSKKKEFWQDFKSYTQKQEKLNNSKKNKHYTGDGIDRSSIRKEQEFFDAMFDPWDFGSN